MPTPPRSPRALDTAFGATLDAPTLPATAAALLLGQEHATLPVVDPASYELGPVIAEGGIGRIRAARDRRLDRPVAIKELRDERRESVVRFVREAWITARLQHPAIIPIYEAGRWPNGEPFYAMKLVLGRSLAEVLDEPRGLEARLGLLRHVLVASEAVAYAHSRGIVHRDLKPANILVGAFGETVVIDWGLAKDTQAPAGADLGAARPELTALGAVLGTPSYMPPEQARGEPANERSDVYALGAILYHLLSGVIPFDGADAGEVLLRVVEGPPAPLASREQGIPDELIGIVEMAMARAPSERYPTARELVVALKRFEDGRLVRAPAPPPPAAPEPAPTQGGRALVVVGLLSIVVCALIWAWFIRDGSERTTHAWEEMTAARSKEQHALARADASAVSQAKELVRDEPARALAWLKTLSPRSTELAAARGVAEQVRKQGLPRSLAGSNQAVSSLAFSPDGKWLATGDQDGAIRLWARDGAPLRALGSASGPVTKLLVSPDGKRLFSLGVGDGARQWDVDTGANVHLREGAAGEADIAISDSGARLAVALGGVVTLHELGKKGASTRPPGQKGWIRKLAFSGENGALVADEGDGRLVSWANPKRPPVRLRAPEAAAPEGAARVEVRSPDGTRAWIAPDGSVRLLGGDVGGAGLPAVPSEEDAFRAWLVAATGEVIAVPAAPSP